jgi:molybdopterin-guanine dinucleotide biosynthesis adapter protein
MRLIISIVGKSDSGKTTLLESLIGELKRRGHKVAIVKHSHHADDLDSAHKDTWRFTRAGSELSAINSLDHLAIYRRMDHYFDPQEIDSFILWDYDVILTEGFKGSNYPKIEVHRHEQGKELLTDPQQLLGVVTDEPLDVKAPQFSHNDINGIADLIEKTILSRQEANEVDLVVNGTYVPIDASLKDLLARTVAAMIPAPANDGGIKNLHLSLRRKA